MPNHIALYHLTRYLSCWDPTHLRSLLDQASSKRICLNLSSTKLLKALLWLQLLASGLPLLTEYTAEMAPWSWLGPLAFLLDNWNWHPFPPDVSSSLSLTENKSTEIFYPVQCFHNHKGNTLNTGLPRYGNQSFHGRTLGAWVLHEHLRGVP